MYIYIYMKPHIMQFTSVSYQFQPLRPKYLPQHHFIRHSETTFFHKCERPYKKRHAILYSFAYFNRYVLRRPTGRDKIPDWAGGIQSLSNDQVIPQHPSSTHDQLRRPENLLLQLQSFFSFSFSFTSSFITISISPTTQRRWYEKWWTGSAWKDAVMA
jgi:hypothetical protein